MGNIIAVVAVLLIHIERNPVIAPKANINRAGLDPIQGRDNIAKAIRRSKPWTSMAWAMKKLPMNRKITGLAKGARTSLADPTAARMQKIGPRRAVIGIGIASVTQ
jgi:hypothetical protein